MEDGVATATVFDGLNRWREEQNAQVTERYLTGRVDELFATWSEGDVVRFNHQDDIGNLVVQIDQEGNSESVRYDSFGNALDATTVDGLFTGRDAISDDLYDFRSRVYDSYAGHFNSQDSVGFQAGDTNLYRYVGNSPVNYVDPLGHTELNESLTFQQLITGVLYGSLAALGCVMGSGVETKVENPVPVVNNGAAQGAIGSLVTGVLVLDAFETVHAVELTAYGGAFNVSSTAVNYARFARGAGIAFMVGFVMCLPRAPVQ